MTEDRLPHRLERSVASRHPVAPQILGEPALEPLRPDPRFTELKRKLGL